MKKSFFIFATIAIVAITMLLSCSSLPKGFVKATDGGTWSSIFIREDLTYDKAFNEVLDVCTKRFEMDMISKEGGYGRTNWSYTWNIKGKYTEKYRTRIIFKFSADHSKVNIKTEAEFGGDPRWIKGFDTRLLQTMKQDISGVVGRIVM